MVQWQLGSKKKKTGGFLKKHSKKKKYQRGRDYLPARVGPLKAKPLRVRGGNYKRIIMAADVANVLVKGKAQKAKILTVTENRANNQFVRRNIITKGAVINTDLGKALVTSRPGQSGVVNAVLLEERKKP